MATLDISRILADPAMVDAAQTLVLGFAAKDPDASPLTPKALPAPPLEGPDIDHVLRWHEDNSQRK